MSQAHLRSVPTRCFRQRDSKSGILMRPCSSMHPSPRDCPIGEIAALRETSWRIANSPLRPTPKGWTAGHTLKYSTHTCPLSAKPPTSAAKTTNGEVKRRREDRCDGRTGHGGENSHETGARTGPGINASRGTGAFSRRTGSPGPPRLSGSPRRPGRRSGLSQGPPGCSVPCGTRRKPRARV